MKPILLSLAASSFVLQCFAQDAPPVVPAPTPPPAAPAPASPAPGSADAPATPAAPEAPAAPSAFPDAKDRKSYALGVFLGNQLKRGAGDNPVNLADVLAGIKSMLDAEKSDDFGRGIQLGTFLKQNELEFNRELLFQTLQESVKGDPSKLSESELRNEMMSLDQEAQGKRQAKAKAAAEKNLAESNAFMEKNKTAEGVTTTPSGLQYKVIKAVEGAAKPQDGEVVSINYKTTLIDGKVVEQSKEGQPRNIGLNINKGFAEGMKLMTVGSKHIFWVPPALGYGETPRPNVKPNSVLIYEVELVTTKKPEPAAPATSQAVPVPGIPGAPGTPGANPNPAMPRKPISATTPPISVEIPPKKGPDAKPATPAPAPTAPAQPSEKKE